MSEKLPKESFFLEVKKVLLRRQIPYDQVLLLIAFAEELVSDQEDFSTQPALFANVLLHGTKYQIEKDPRDTWIFEV